MKNDFIITEIVSVQEIQSSVGAGESVIYSTKLMSSELIFAISNENVVTFSKSIIKDSPGSVRILPKGENGGIYRVDIIHPGKCIDIYFNTDIKAFDEAIGIKPELVKQLDVLFFKIYNEWKTKKVGYYHTCMSLLYKIFAEIEIVTKSSYIPERKQKLLAPAEKYIEEHCFDVDFDFTVLHMLCGICYTYFKRLFCEKYGVTPIKYVTNLKIAYAKELLSLEKYSVSEIAKMVGYENVYYFSKVFKSKVGEPPTVYRVYKTDSNAQKA